MLFMRSFHAELISKFHLSNYKFIYRSFKNMVLFGFGVNGKKTGNKYTGMKRTGKQETN